MIQLNEYLINKQTKEKKDHKFNPDKPEDYLLCQFMNFCEDYCLLDTAYEVSYIVESSHIDKLFTVYYYRNASGAPDENYCNTFINEQPDVIYDLFNINTGWKSMSWLLIRKDTLKDLLWLVKKNGPADIHYYLMESKRILDHGVTKLASDHVRWHVPQIQNLLK